jgi:adenylosuccinate synthase
MSIKFVDVIVDLQFGDTGKCGSIFEVFVDTQYIYIRAGKHK